MIRSIAEDARYALRGLSRAPGFAAVAILTLALGIGANTTIFSVLNGILLSPLPYQEPEGLVRVWPERNFSKELLTTFQQRARTFEALSGYAFTAVSLTGEERPEVLQGTLVSPGHLALLGVRPTLGRALLPEDSQPGSEPVAVLGHRLWESRFAADPGVVGRSVLLDGRLTTVVGVLPADFRPLAPDSQVWMPITVDPADLDDYRDMLFLRALGRLAPDTSLTAARAEVQEIAAGLARELPEYYPEEQVRAAGAIPLLESMVGDVRPTLLILTGAVGLVLLVACANVANLLLTRSDGRRREIAVRTALGAGGRRVVRLLLTESAVLGLVGGAAGLVVAAWTQALLLDTLPGGTPRAGAVGLEGREIAFATGLALVTALLFGLAPALRCRRPDATVLRQGGAGGPGGAGRQGLSRGLVTVEIAVSVVLVATAGLMLKSLWRLGQVEPGFNPGGVLSMRLTPPAGLFSEQADLRAFLDGALERVRAVPGVTGAGAISHLPMAPGNMGVAYSADPSPEPGAPPDFVSYRTVTPGYFRTLGIPLLAGRSLGAGDRPGAPEVGIINQALADKHWPDADAVGRVLYWDDGSPWFTVVGVVGDVRQHRLDRGSGPEVYRPYAQAPAPSVFLTARTAGSPLELAREVQEAVWSVSGDVPISRVEPLDAVVRGTLADARFTTLLLAGFAALALVLGAVGVYGVGSYAVSRRTREIGVRMALGAARGTMLRSILLREMAPVALGLALGLLAALAVTQVLRSSLFGVSATNPAVLAAVAGVLALVALAAGYLPARRAARVEPVVALRSE